MHRLAFLEKRVVLEAHVASAHESGQDVLESAAVEVPVREELTMELPDGFLPTANRQSTQHALGRGELRTARRPVRQGDALGKERKTSQSPQGDPESCVCPKC